MSLLNATTTVPDYRNGKVSVKYESEDLPEFNSLKNVLRKHFR